MTNALISTVDWVSAGTTLSTNSEVEGLGVANLATWSPEEVWRSLPGPGRWVQADFGGPVEVGVVCLVMPRSGVQLGAGDGITLMLDAATPGAGALLSAPMINADYGYWWRFLPVAQHPRYLRLNIDSTLPYVQGGRLWVGPARVMTRNFGFDWSREWADDGRKTRAPKSGRRFRTAGPRYRRLSIAFPRTSPADADAIEDADRRLGCLGQMLICTHPDAPQKRVLLGTPESVTPITQPRVSSFSKTYVIEEDL